MRQLVGIALSIGILAASCNKVPKDVIQPEEMAQLMADVRIADAIVEYNPRKYDEAGCIALKNAVFAKHGISNAQFDSSLVWYGHNIGRYQEVTDRSIEILEQREKEVATMAAGDYSVSVSGDSVDIWQGRRYAVITDKSPSQYLTFSSHSDQNWEKGDIYTFRARAVTQIADATWNLTAEYDDGAVSVLSSDISSGNTGRQEITLYTDSTKTATRISGWIKVVPEGGRPAIIDSISVIRRRNEAIPVNRRRNIQRNISGPEKENTQTQDTLDVPFTFKAR